LKLVHFSEQTPSDINRTPTSGGWLRGLLGVSLYRNSIYLILNSAIPAVTGFAFWMIATRLYPVENIGIAAAAISMMTLLTFLSTLGLEFGLIRFIPNAGRKANEILNSCFTSGTLVAIVLSTVFVVGLSIWAPSLIGIRQNPIFSVAFVVFTTAFTLHTLVHHVFVAKRKAGFALVQGVVFSLLRFVPLICLAGLFHTFGIFASWGIALVLAMSIGILIFLPRVQADYRPVPRISRRAISDLMRFSFGNYGASIFWMAPSLILPLMVTNLLGAESNAYFYIGWAVANIILMVPLSISLSLFAEGAHDEQKLTRDVTRSLKLILLIIVPAIAVAFLAGDKILLLFGEAYSVSSTRLLWILAMSALPASVNYIYFSVKRVQARMKSVVGLSALMALTTLILSFFLLPQWGIVGAGVSYLAAQAIPACGTGLWLIRTQNTRGARREPEQ